MSSSKCTPENAPRIGSAKVQVVTESVGISESFSVAALRPLPQDHPFYAKIGRITAEWARLEHVLDVTIWELAGIDPDKGSALTGQMLGTNGRLSAISALAALHGHSKRTMADIEELQSASNITAKLRNRFVHDAWYIQDANGETSAGQFKNLSATYRRAGTIISPSGFSPIRDDSIDGCLSKIQRRIDEATVLRRALCGKQRT